MNGTTPAADQAADRTYTSALVVGVNPEEARNILVTTGFEGVEVMACVGDDALNGRLFAGAIMARYGADPVELTEQFQLRHSLQVLPGPKQSDFPFFTDGEDTAPPAILDWWGDRQDIAEAMPSTTFSEVVLELIDEFGEDIALYAQRQLGECPLECATVVTHAKYASDRTVRRTIDAINGGRIARHVVNESGSIATHLP